MTKSAIVFKRIILYARQYRANQEVNETLKHVIGYLNSNNIEIVQDEDTKAIFNLDLPILARNEMGKPNDLILVVGGDGSLLSAARLAISVNVPVIGINRGRLGFLTDISPQNINDELGTILRGQYIEEKRFLLKMTLNNDEKYAENALNDIVLNRGEQTHLISFDVYINQEFVNHYRSDGLIISTPTGSTAYSLSAGGPIMHPGLNAIVIVPMFAHTLSARPLVIDGNDQIEIEVCKDNEASLQISCDGNLSHALEPGQRMKIEKNPAQLRLLHPQNYQYYDTLRIKLGWGRKSG